MKAHPAESITGATAIAMLLAIIIGVTDEVAIAAMIGALGMLPGAVTVLVNNGGVTGVVRLLLYGRRKDVLDS